MIARSDRKTDRQDAEKLARYARVDPAILCPVTHRTAGQQADLVVLRARAALVRARTLLGNAARGLVKPFGARLPACDADRRAARGLPEVPAAVRAALTPLLEQVASLTARIRVYDQQVEALAAARYPEAAVLRSVPGVGPLTSLCFVLTLGDQTRFAHSRDAACYVGLRPKRRQSGERDPELGITRAGDGYLRTLLVECAQHVLRRNGPDSALRQWGLRLATHGGQNAKKRAIVAVARKLAVVLHRMGVTQQRGEPFRGAARPATAALAQ